MTQENDIQQLRREGRSIAIDAILFSNFGETPCAVRSLVMARLHNAPSAALPNLHSSSPHSPTPSSRHFWLPLTAAIAALLIIAAGLSIHIHTQKDRSLQQIARDLSWTTTVSLPESIPYAQPPMRDGGGDGSLPTPKGNRAGQVPSGLIIGAPPEGREITRSPGSVGSGAVGTRSVRTPTTEIVLPEFIRFADLNIPATLQTGYQLQTVLTNTPERVALLYHRNNTTTLVFLAHSQGPNTAFATVSSGQRILFAGRQQNILIAFENGPTNEQQCVSLYQQCRQTTDSMQINDQRKE